MDHSRLYFTSCGQLFSCGRGQASWQRQCDALSNALLGKLQSRHSCPCYCAVQKLLSGYRDMTGVIFALKNNILGGWFNCGVEGIWFWCDMSSTKYTKYNFAIILTKRKYVYNIVYYTSAMYFIKHIRHGVDLLLWQHAALRFKSRGGERERERKIEDKVDCNGRRGERKWEEQRYESKKEIFGYSDYLHVTYSSMDRIEDRQRKDEDKGEE